MSDYEVKCLLDYKIDDIEIKPLENCPKLKTIKQEWKIHNLKYSEGMTNERLAN